MTGALAAILIAASPFGPFPSRGHPVTREGKVPQSDFFEVAYAFYSAFITPIDGPRCMHRPTCSRYGLLAVREHGAVGLLLTLDRLMRDENSSALRRLKSFVDEGGIHFVDPVEESSFWFTAWH